MSIQLWKNEAQRASKHGDKSLISLAISEMSMKTMWRIPIIPVKKTNEGVEKMWTLYTSATMDSSVGSSKN